MQLGIGRRSSLIVAVCFGCSQVPQGAPAANAPQAMPAVGAATGTARGNAQSTQPATQSADAKEELIRVPRSSEIQDIRLDVRQGNSVDPREFRSLRWILDHARPIRSDPSAEPAVLLGGLPEPDWTVHVRTATARYDIQFQYATGLTHGYGGAMIMELDEHGRTLRYGFFEYPPIPTAGEKEKKAGQGEESGTGFD